MYAWLCVCVCVCVSVYNKCMHVFLPCTEVTGLSKTVKTANEVVVSWMEVEGAKKYVLNLYTNSTQQILRASYEQTLPTTLVSRLSLVLLICYCW